VVTNSGGKTAGTDDVVWEGPEEYFEAIEELSQIVKEPNKYVASPLVFFCGGGRSPQQQKKLASQYT
jgi:hypothetical protein